MTTAMNIQRTGSTLTVVNLLLLGVVVPNPQTKGGPQT